MAVTDIETLFKEIYDETVPDLWTKGHALVNELMRAPKIQANTRAVVFNQTVAPGGDFKGMDFDGGTYPKGNSLVTKKPTVSSIGVTLGFNATSLMQWASKNNKLSVRNFMDQQIALAMDTFKDWMECLLNAQDSDGVLAILSGVQNTTEYILNSADDIFGGYLLIEGGRYDIIASASFPDTERANGPYRILPDGGLDKRLSPAIVQFSQAGASSAAAITGFTAEDRVVARDLADASINPIAYHVNGAASGTWQTLDRAKPHNRSQRVDGGSQPLEAAHVRLLLAGILKYKGTSAATSGLRPYLGYEQKVNWEDSAESVSVIQLESASGPGVGQIYDRMLGDVKINKTSPILSNRANPSEFRFIRPDDFRWVVTKDIGFEPNESGGRLHRNYDPDEGTIQASHSFYINYQCNLGAADVSSMGVVDTLSVPSLASA